MQGIDEVKVEEWLNANIEGAQGPYTYDLIAGGRSNLTFHVTDSHGTQMVLRRPPMGHVLATAHDMAREHRIISAVGKTNVPVPRTLGVCTDEEVNGAPFYVMAFVDGVVLDSPDKGLLLPEALSSLLSLEQDQENRTTETSRRRREVFILRSIYYPTKIFTIL